MRLASLATSISSGVPGTLPFVGEYSGAPDVSTTSPNRPRVNTSVTVRASGMVTLMPSYRSCVGAPPGAAGAKGRSTVVGATAPVPHTVTDEKGEASSVTVPSPALALRSNSTTRAVRRTRSPGCTGSVLSNTSTPSEVAGSPSPAGSCR